ncbi:hypothetical protein BKA83DRAFT_4177259 [Pisolithus microcarpus]|nr:hypothetical protein BKA83DRAFT_4177259 [Pisolithus microcarpus]
MLLWIWFICQAFSTATRALDSTTLGISYAYASQDLKLQHQWVHVICIISLLGLRAIMSFFPSISERRSHSSSGASLGTTDGSNILEWMTVTTLRIWS